MERQEAGLRRNGSGCNHAECARADYGYLWWLNTKQKQWPSAPATSFAALGNGSNMIWIDPEHDIVFVWHWYDKRAMTGSFSA